MKDQTNAIIAIKEIDALIELNAEFMIKLIEIKRQVVESIAWGEFKINDGDN
jgi:hypothetical protein